jgi:hypothetical protein
MLTTLSKLLEVSFGGEVKGIRHQYVTVRMTFSIFYTGIPEEIAYSGTGTVCVYGYGPGGTLVHSRLLVTHRHVALALAGGGGGGGITALLLCVQIEERRSLCLHFPDGDKRHAIVICTNELAAIRYFGLASDAPDPTPELINPAGKLVL